MSTVLIECLYFIILDPAGFVTHPKNQLINMGDVVQLSCSFYKNTGQDFYWKRDGERLTDGTKVLPPADNTNMSTFKKGNRIISQLSLLASKPDIQGLYSCEVKDKTESIKSKEGRVQLNGKLLPIFITSCTSQKNLVCCLAFLSMTTICRKT